MRVRLALVLSLTLLLLCAAPALAQSNPTPDSCGLPKGGVIYTAVTYTLTSDCTQTSKLTIHADIPANSTVTIDGKGYTVEASSLNGTDEFLWCVGLTKDNLKVEIKDLTIKGGGSNGSAALKLDRCHGDLDRVTITDSGGRAIYSAASSSRTITLDSVLIQRSGGGYQFYHRTGALEFSGDLTVNITNSVFRDVTSLASALVNTDAQSGTTSITLNGCLTKERIYPQFSYGDITDNSTGACTGTIGNGGSADLPNPAPTAGACGLPLQGVLQNSASYSLTANCQLTGPLYIPKGLTVSINGNGYKIKSPSGKRGIHTGGTTTISNAVFDGGSDANLVTALKSNLTVTQSTFRNHKRPLRIYDATITFDRVLFEENDVGTYNWGSVMQVFRSATVTVRDSILRDNKGGRGAIFIGFPHSSSQNIKPSVTLTGCTNFSGNTPADSFINNSGNDGTLTNNASGACTGQIGAVEVSEAVAPSKDSDETSSAGSQRSRARSSTRLPICSGHWLNQNTGIRVWATYGLCSGVQFRRLQAGWVTGNQQVIDAGFMDAVDVYGYAEQGVEVCFPAYGAMVLLDASTSPRTLEPLHSYRDEHWICGAFAKAGTAVLISANSGLADAPMLGGPAAELSNCMVTTTHVLNLRDEPNGEVIGMVAHNLTLTALSRTDAWFEVDANGVTGWISADYVTMQGDCG